MQCDFHATHHTVVVSSAYGLKSVVVNLLQQTNLLGEFRRLVQTVCCLEKLWLVIGASCIYNDFVTPTHNMHHVGAKPHIFPLNGEFVVIYHGKKRKQFPEASNKSQILLWDPFFMRYLHLYLVIHWVPGFLLQLKTKTQPCSSWAFPSLGNVLLQDDPSWLIVEQLSLEGPLPKTNIAPEKWSLGDSETTVLSFWEGLFSEDMLVSGRVSVQEFL